MDQQLETTLVVAQAMVDELTDYLMDGALYRQLIIKTPEGTKQPKMTIGALLENLETLQWQRDNLTVQQRAVLDAIAQRVDIDRTAFNDPWRALLRRELKALMDSWKWYLDDAARDESARENYPNEARIRTRIDLVNRALADDSQTAAERKELGALDAQLQGMIRPGGFVGPAGEQAHYPKNQAWWLYGKPAGEND